MAQVLLPKEGLVLEVNPHKREWERFYSPLKLDYWPEIYGEEYSLLDIHLLSQQEVEEIRLVAKRVGKIFDKTVELLRKVPEKILWELDYDENTYDFIRAKFIEAETIISRVDLAKTPEGYKVMEINSDTPTFIKECFNINQILCNYFKRKNPNQGLESELSAAVKQAILESYQAIGGQGNPYVVFTSHGEHIEDRFTSMYLMEKCGLSNVAYCALEDLRINQDGVYDKLDRKIDVLYRQTYPIEYLVHDVHQESGRKIGLMLLDHVLNKRVAIVNPPSAFLMQSKGLQVLIWGLYEEDEFFTEEELQWIEDYFLPTYWEAEWLIEEGKPYVKKPCFGREGDTVEIFDSTGKLMYTNPNQNYTDSAPVYQQYVELPKTMIKTTKGEREAHFMIGCFLLKGEPSAIGIRAGNIITDNWSYFLPVGLR